MPNQFKIIAAACVTLAGCASGPTVSAAAKPGKALFDASPQNTKQAVSCTAAYQDVGRYANNPMKDVPDNLAYWTARHDSLVPDAAKRQQMDIFVHELFASTYSKAGKGMLDGLQAGANFERVVYSCANLRAQANQPG